ncbi:MAG: hypothetical protein V1717_00765 [Candidatus Micrarchaeota archaeon]
MGFTSWLNSKMKKLVWTDVSLIKIGVAAFVLAAAKLWPPLLSLDWYWYAAVFVLAVIKPTLKFFGK